MDNFITAIRKTNTDGLIFFFSRLSIEMFKNNEYIMNLQYPLFKNGLLQNHTVTLMGWDILSIEYLSVKYSNDYRYSKKRKSPAELVGLYRSYENKNQHNSKSFSDNLSDIFQTILGMTAEQFAYNNLYWIFEKFNRNYYILVAAENMEHRHGIDVNAITKDVFGLSAKDYISVFTMLMWLCMQNPEPLSAPDELFRKKKIQL